jgi:hypothetical protein
MANIHIGKKIKEVVGQSRYTAKDFASKINVSRTVVYDIFKRGTINTGLLLKISKVLDHDFFGYYHAESPWIAKDEKPTYNRKNDAIALLHEELQSAKKLIADLKQKCELLEKLNKLTEEKLGILERRTKK